MFHAITSPSEGEVLFTKRFVGHFKPVNIIQSYNNHLTSRKTHIYYLFINFMCFRDFSYMFSIFRGYLFITRKLLLRIKGN